MNKLKKYITEHETVKNIPELLTDCYNLKDSSGSADISSVVDFLTRSKGSISCVVGPPGSGKTFLLYAILLHWIAKKPKADEESICLYFDMKKWSGRGTTSGYREMFKSSSLYCDMESDLLEQTIHAMAKENGRGVILLLDHFNVLNMTQLKESILFKLLHRESLPQATVIVAGLATMLNLLTVTCESPCRTYVLDGIRSGSESKLLQLMKVQLKAERVAEYVQYYCLELCRIPGMLATLLPQLREKPPRTYSDIGEALIIARVNDWTSSSIFSKTCQSQTYEKLQLQTYYEKIQSQTCESQTCGKIQSLSTLPQDVADQLALVCKLAYLSLESDSDHYLYYSETDIRKFMTSNMKDGDIEDFGLGLLLTTVVFDNEVANLRYQFTPILLEFLAAYYVASLPVLDQIRIFCRNVRKFLFGGKHSNFSKVYFGMPFLLSKFQTASKKLTLSTMTLKPLLETVIISQLYDDEEQTVKSKKLKFVLQLLHESQDKNLVSKFLNRREKYLDLTLRLSAIPEPLVNTLAFVIAHSGISKWSIQTSEKIKYSAEYISDLVRKESGKKVEVRVYTDTSSTDVFRVMAHAHGGAQAKTFPPLTAHARCMREVLHRLLQLYSPIKLRSNSTEPSFVSFLVCECLKDKLEKEQMLVIEPIHAIHWVTVKMKKEKPAGGKVTTDEKDLYRHMAQHRMEQLEMVLMMSPLPHRIRYRDPLDSDKVETIELCNNEDPHFLDGRIAASLQDHLRGDETLDESFVAMETKVGSSPSDQCVASPFLIPSCFKEIMGHIVLDPNIAETYTLTLQQPGIEASPEDTRNQQEPLQIQDNKVETDGRETGTQDYRVETDGTRETLWAQDITRVETRVETRVQTLQASWAQNTWADTDQQTWVQTDQHEPQDTIQVSWLDSQENSKQSGRNGQSSYRNEEALPINVGNSAGTNPANFISQESVRQNVQLSQVAAQQSFQVPTGNYTSTQNRNRMVQPHYLQQPHDLQQPPQLEAVLSPKQSAQPSVQQSLTTNVQRQVAAPPGTVLHSADPSVFAVDSVYPLPGENTLIKKGGNGSVFAVRYSGKEYAVKKTAFRQKEFAIHKKLKHVNIVELTCFMFGTQQPHQRRRYFCYHFMPRVTGDLARMVTDKPHLTMRSLSSKYENDPRKLGSMRGNWKYVLKELLKGLGYMHSLGVVHRDMKASNVLIKMHCSCDNPLTCVCSQKCSVKISDFDAALQLDSSSGLLRPSLPANKPPAQQSVYQITPVGTDGYRSPESSQLTLSNHLSIINPPLTVKSDIWSVGLILLRILNGANGPTTQKKLSTLLLYYEQQKQASGTKKPHAPRFMWVTKNQVEEIIGLHYFSEVSSSWISQAVQCIAKCVEVDPEKRPSAKELLKDPFLY